MKSRRASPGPVLLPAQAGRLPVRCSSKGGETPKWRTGGCSSPSTLTQALEDRVVRDQDVALERRGSGIADGDRAPGRRRAPAAPAIGNPVGDLDDVARAQLGQLPAHGAVVEAGRGGPAAHRGELEGCRVDAQRVVAAEDPAAVELQLLVARLEDELGTAQPRDLLGARVGDVPDPVLIEGPGSVGDEIADRLVGEQHEGGIELPRPLGVEADRAERVVVVGGARRRGEQDERAEEGDGSPPGGERGARRAARAGAPVRGGSARPTGPPRRSVLSMPCSFRCGDGPPGGAAGKDHSRERSAPGASGGSFFRLTAPRPNPLNPRCRGQVPVRAAANSSDRRSRTRQARGKSPREADDAGPARRAVLPP